VDHGNEKVAKTIVQGKTLIVLPDDKSTFEVLSRVPNVRAVGPRQPRIIIYDVVSDNTGEEIVNGSLEQNPELDLTQDDVEAMVVMHKLGPRNGSSVHWVIENQRKCYLNLKTSQFYGLDKMQGQLAPECSPVL